MNIKEYLEKYGIPQTAFARRLQVNRNTIRDYMAGKYYPRPDIAKMIVEITDGQVTLEDIFNKKDSNENFSLPNSTLEPVDGMRSR